MLFKMRKASNSGKDNNRDTKKRETEVGEGTGHDLLLFFESFVVIT